jgi:2-haloacid dehalogenase
MANRGIEVVTFDCYNTLVDARGGGAVYLYNVARRNGEQNLEPGWKIRDEWEAIQFELLQGDFIPYREVLRRSIRTWVERHGYEWNEQIHEDIVGVMEAYQPYPDTRPALQQVKDAGLKLVIISNADRDIIEHTARQIAIPFDDIITSQDAGAYKPSDTVFDYAKQRIGVSDEKILHVAFGFKYDLAAATNAGWGTAWINRHNEPKPDGPDPDHIWRDLWGLADYFGCPGPWFE